jgi:uncharacterized protein YraI
MKKIIYSLASLALCTPLFAGAAEGVLVSDISLQAGPDTQYPSIEELNAGTSVSIQGCLDGWSWCDVIASNGDRGWVPGTFIEETYDNQRVVVTDYGSRIGIPIVSFSIGAYWGSHYHDRPFYTQRQQWESRSIHVRTPPRPSGVATTTRPTDTRTTTQTQERRTTATTPQRTAPTAVPTPSASERAATERADSTRRTDESVAKMTHPQARPRPEPQAKPESAPMAAKPSDMPERTKPVERAPQVAQAAKPAAGPKPKDEAKAHEPKPKDELKPEKKKDDSGGGGG